MKFFGILFLGAMLLLCSCSSIKNLECDLDVTELEKCMDNAMDPNGTFAKADSFYQVQVLKIDRLFGTDIYEIRTSYKKPHFLRVTTYKHNERISGVIFNGNSAWKVDYKEQTVDPITGDDFIRLKICYDMNNPDSSYQDLFEFIQLTKHQSKNDVFYKLICKNDIDSKNTMAIYVNADNFLINRLNLDFIINNQGKKQRIKDINIIQAYESVDGVKYPLQILRKTNGIESTLNTYRYQLNAPIDDSKFKPPLFPKDSEKRQLHRMKMLEKDF